MSTTIMRTLDRAPQLRSSDLNRFAGKEKDQELTTEGTEEHGANPRSGAQAASWGSRRCATILLEPEAK